MRKPEFNVGFASPRLREGQEISVPSATGKLENVADGACGKTGELAAAGAAVAASIAGACRGREVVVSMLSDDAALE